jgi:hypothetical protein
MLPTSKYMAFLIAFATLILGASVILGWHAFIITLIQYQYETIAMVYNTALSFVLIAISSYTLIYRFTYVTQIISAIVFTISLIVILNYLLNLNIPIDEFFFRHYRQVENIHPGRMAPNTAFCFILSSIAVFTLAGSRFQKYSVIIGGSIGFFTLILSIFFVSGYVSNLQQAYKWSIETPMAANTAIGFILIGSNIMALTSYQAALFNLDINKSLPYILAFFILITTFLLTQAINEQQNLYGQYTKLPQVVMILGSIFALLFGLLLRFALKASAEETAAMESRAILRSILESTADGILVTNKKGDIVDYNKKFIDMWQLSEHKIKKSNRKANLYSCDCGNHVHADLNASRNIVNKYLEQQSA